MSIDPHKIACLLALAALAGAGCRRTSSDSPEAAVPAVRFVKPAVQEVTEYSYFTGRMDAVQSVDVRARVTGYLEEIKFTEGQEVKEGDLLFKIDPRPYQAVADEAHSQIALSKARLDLAKANFNRLKEIARTPGAVSQQEVDTTAATLEQANAQLQASLASAKSADLNLEFTNVIAPINGIISRTLFTVGNLITQDSTLLTTIVSSDPMYAYFDVDERSMLRYQALVREGKVKSARAGEEVPVQLGLANEDNQYPHEGTLDFVNNQVDPLTGTIQVRGVFANPLPARGKTRFFTPGLFVRVRMPIGEAQKAMVIPQAAIAIDQGRKYVLVVNDQDIVKYCAITTGPELPNGMQVAIPVNADPKGDKLPVPEADEQSEESLTPNDRVIVGGLQKVRPGDRVLPRPVE